jgi:hypothetical protein
MKLLPEIIKPSSIASPSKENLKAGPIETKKEVSELKAK